MTKELDNSKEEFFKIRKTDKDWDIWRQENAVILQELQEDH